MLANGHLEEDISKVQATQRYAQPPQLFWNAGREAKSELVLVPESSTGKDFYQPVVGRGAAFGDFDEDGDLSHLFIEILKFSPPPIYQRDDLGTVLGLGRMQHLPMHP